MKYKKYLLIGLQVLFVSLLTSCTDSDKEIEGVNGDNDENANEVVELPNDEDDNIENSTFSSCVKITYGDGFVMVDNPREDSVAVVVNGAEVVVTSMATEVEYEVSGSTTDGFLKIYSDYKFKLTLAGVSIVNPNGPAINIQSHKRVFVELNAENQLEDGSTYMSSNEDQKATFFSEGQLIFMGDGLLNLKGNYKHALCSDDYIRLLSGRITVTYAVADGVHSLDAFIMEGGFLNVISMGDAVQCENTIVVTDGSLTLTTSGSKGHALVSESDMKLAGGLYTINVAGSASKGIKCDGNLIITDGTYNVKTKGDCMYDTDEKDVSGVAGIKCEGICTISGASTSVTCTSTGKGGKGMSVGGILTVNDATVTVETTGSTYSYTNSLDSKAKGIRCESNIVINSGHIFISAIGGEGCEGLESKNTILVNGGTIEVTAYDDAFNASHNITVNNGYVYCYALNNDGMDSNGTININGGWIVSSGTSTPEEGIDCDQNVFSITGGMFIGTGGATSLPTASSSTQNSVAYGGSGSKGTIFRVESLDGTEIITYTVPRTLSSMTYLFSTPTLVNESSYLIYMGGTITGGTEFHGLHFGATYTKDILSTSFTVLSRITTVGNISGGFGNGGGGFPVVPIFK